MDDLTHSLAFALCKPAREAVNDVTKQLHRAGLNEKEIGAMLKEMMDDAITEALDA